MSRPRHLLPLSYKNERSRRTSQSLSLKEPFKLAIVNLTGGGLSGGYVKYLNRMIPRLTRDARIAHIDVILPSRAREHVMLDSVPIYPYSGRAALQRHLYCLQPDLVFIPTARWIGSKRVPTVVMVRNMEPLSAPLGGNRLYDCAINLIRNRIARKACRSATRVIAVSEYVGEFLENWNIPRQKIGVVYHGVDVPLSTEQTLKPGAVPMALKGNFVFTAGSIRPARGLEDVVKAFSSPSLDFWLVIAGDTTAGTEFYRERIVRLADELGIGGKIIWAGQLNAFEMSWCFYNARAFVMTSRAEACPNVALEAMAHGCICISTDTPPMPEFFRDCAFYYRQGDACSLRACLEQVLFEDRPSVPSRKAMARAGAFTWEKSAIETVDQLEAAVLAYRRSEL